MNWNERITLARERKGMSKTDFWRALKVSSATATNWENGVVKSIKGENLVNVCRVLGVTEEWLLHGIEPNSSKIIAVDDDEPGYVYIKKVKLRLSAGISGYKTIDDNEEGQSLSFRRSWLEKKGYRPEKLIAIGVKGESMEPALYDGDTVIINTADTKIVDGEVYAVNYEGEAVIKRLVRDLGQWYLSSDNTDQRKYGRKNCRGESCIIVGKVVLVQSERI